MTDSGTPVIAKTVNAVAAIGAAVYFGLVVYNKNMPKLLAEAKQDIGFVEFLIAAMVLNMLISNKNTRPYVLPLTFVGVVAILIKSFSNFNAGSEAPVTGIQAISENLQRFGKGEISLLQVFGVNPSAIADTSQKGNTNG